MTGRVSLGLAGALGPGLIGALAPAIESAGFSALWVNDTPGGDSLAPLAAAAEATTTLRLATGVIPIDRRSASEIAVAVAARGLPEDRLTLGIGSGALAADQVAAVRAAADQLRTRTRAAVYVGALGPRMRRLAVTAADGVLLNWLTPDAAAAQSGELAARGRGAGIALYVRTAFDDRARAKAVAEAERYAAIPAYAANFARLGIDVHDTVLIEADPAPRLREYRAAVEETVLRAVTPTDSERELRAFVERAAALGV